MKKLVTVPGFLLLAATVLAQNVAPRASAPVEQPVTTAPASAPAELSPERLEAGLLVHQARSLGHFRGTTQGRAGRILAMLSYAQRLAPDDLLANRRLMEMYEGQGDIPKAVEHARKALAADPTDFPLLAQWLRLALSTLQSADEKVALLKELQDNAHLNNEARAAAAGQLADLYLRQGEIALARQTSAAAGQLDELEPLALSVKSALVKMEMERSAASQPADSQPASDPAIAAPIAPVATAPTASMPAGALAGVPLNTVSPELVAIELDRFRLSPRDYRQAWAVGQMLQSAGLDDRLADGKAADKKALALPFYDLAYDLMKIAHPPEKVQAAFLIDYFNEFLDLGKPARVIEVFEPFSQQFKTNLPLRALVLEAYRSGGKEDLAVSQAAVMGQAYHPILLPNAKRTPQQSAELAWFYLMFKRENVTAVIYADEAAKAGSDDPFVQRVIGCVKLATGERIDGLARLSPLVAADPYAAECVARYLFNDGQVEQARGVLLRAAGGIRTGPAWRLLASLAAEKQVKIPPLSQAGELVKLVQSLPAAAMEMAESPKPFLAIRLSALNSQVQVGEPVEVAVELENISKQPLPLGSGGFINPTLMLNSVADSDGRLGLGTNGSTTVVLPAPKYLGPGQKLRQVVRVDLGSLETLLANHPLVEVRLAITATLDPLTEDAKVFSSAPGIDIAGVTVKRLPLTSGVADDQAAYARLALIVKDLREGDLPTQLRAARQTGALLAYVREVELGRGDARYEKVIAKPVLLSMMRAFLQAKSELVRAEMLSALNRAELEDRIVAQLPPELFGDASPLVRMQLIQLLAAGEVRGYKDLLAHFVNDADPQVRQMADAFAGRATADRSERP